jgi:hypothetical protein
MEFHHSCSFCGWSRVSATPVMLSPSCAGCGCALDAVASTRVGHHGGGGSEQHASPLLVVLPAAALPVLRRMGVLLGALMLYAAAKVGYDSAGASGAMIAFGAGGFLLLPFVPERVGAGARSQRSF